MKTGDRIEFRIAQDTEWVHYLGTVSGPVETVDAPVGWPTATITWVPVSDVVRADGTPSTWASERIEIERIV